MNDAQKNEAQLLEEIASLRQRVVELESQTAIQTLIDEKAQEIARYRGLFNQSNDAIYIITLDRIIIDCNQRAAEMHGLPLDEMIGSPLTRFIVPDAHQAASNIHKRLLAGEKLPPYERMLRRGDGTQFPAEINIEMIYDRDGRPAYLQSIVRDITERKQAEEDLRKSEAKYRQIMEQASDGILIADEEGYYVDANTMICTMLGYSRDELLTMRIADIVAAEDLAMQPIPWDEMRTGTVLLERRLRRKDGSLFYAEVSAKMLEGDRLQIFVRDVTERMQTEAALRESEERFRTIFESAPIGMVITGAERQIVDSNQAFQDLVGYTQAELATMTFADITHPDDMIKSQEISRNLRAGGQRHYTIEKRYLHKSGRVVWAVTSTFALYDSHGAYKNAVILITDISERIQAEAALRQSEERFRTIFESAPIGMVITDTENRLIQTNQAFQQMIEYSQDELAMMTSDDITHPNDLEQNQTVRGMWQADDCNHVTVEKRYVTKSGGVLWAITSVFRLFDAHGREINSVAMITDITAHKNAEAKLRESETLYRTLTANLPKSAVMIYDHDLRFVLVDGPEIEAAGFTKAMLEGHIVHDVLPAEFVEAVEPYLQGALRGETHCVELPFGDHLIYELTYLPLREHNDHIIHGMILARNITDLREAEQQARELESAKEQERERYRALFEQSNDGIFLMGLDGHYIDCNQRAADMLGYTREEIVNMTYRDVSPPSEHPKALLIFEQLMRNETPPIYERTLLKKDGTTFPAEIRVEVVRDADHNPLHIQSVVRDITERKQHEQALRESEAKYRSMIESLAEGIIVQNADNIVIAANTSAERMLGIPGKQMINQRADVVDLHLIREDGTRIPRDQYPARVTLRTGLPQNNLIAGIVQPNKPVLWISINTRPLFNEYSDQPIAVVLSFTDITEFKKAQQERFEMTLEKERMQVLRDFINDASHDLKTPITTINTSLYLIGKQDVSEAIKRHLDVVQSQADYLTKLVDDMFTMTRLDAEYELEFRSVDVYRLVRKVLLETEALALQKRHEVVFDAADDRPLIHADSNYLRRALINIIGNAIKYTPEGGTINVRIDRNERYVIIAVQDNGIGIDDHDLEHIFERFYRADKARGSEGGTGLGLAITRKIIEAHNGCITVESEATRGSTFTLHLPLAEQVESTEK